MNFVKIFRNILLLVVLPLFSKSLYPKTVDTLYVDANTIKDNALLLDNTWLYHSGDDSIWADPSFNDADWDTVRTIMYFKDFPQANWKGIGWFRKVISIDSALYNQTLALRVHHYGASEIYVNGRLQCSIGKINSDPDKVQLYHNCPTPVPLELDSNKYYTLAVRYLMPESTLETFWYSKIITHIGFRIIIDDLGRSIKVLGDDDYFAFREIEYVGMIGPLLSLSLLFFLLFFFSSKQKEYLFYSFYLFFLVIAILFVWLNHTVQTDFIYKYFYLVLHRSSIILAVITLLACFYTIFYQNLLKSFWYFLTVSIVIIIYNIIYLNDTAFYLYLGLNIIIGIEDIRIIIVALNSRKRNSWVIGIGFIFTFMAFILQTLMIGGIVNLWNYFNLITYITVFSFPITIMFYLVRSYSDININLEKQLVTIQELSSKEIENEKKTAALTIKAEKEKSAKKNAELRAQIAEAENERKTKELEQAHQLQLSMLPKEIPSLSNLDIAVYMKTATEVGGDYYDFYKSEDNMLNIVIGDATGHGIDACMMVSVTKGLFQNLAPYTDLEEVMNKFNYSLQSMKLQPMYMTLRILRIKNSHLEVIGAGMYPFLIFEKSTGVIREVESNGPPLGTIPHFNYHKDEFDLSTGDTIILMTDGFTERRNNKNEMIGDERTKDILRKIGYASANEVIERFVNEFDEWGGESVQDDDVTFIVIKMK